MWIYPNALGDEGVVLCQFRLFVICEEGGGIAREVDVKSARGDVLVHSSFGICACCNVSVGFCHCGQHLLESLYVRERSKVNGITDDLSDGTAPCAKEVIV